MCVFMFNGLMLPAALALSAVVNLKVSWKHRFRMDLQPTTFCTYFYPPIRLRRVLLQGIDGYRWGGWAMEKRVG